MKEKTANIERAERFDRLQFTVRLFMDAAAISGAWFFSYYVRFVLLSGYTSDSYLFYITLYVIALVTGFIFNYTNGLYESSVTKHWSEEVSGLFKSSVETFLAFTVIYYFLFSEKISRLHLLIFPCFLFILLILDRMIVNKVMASEIKSGKFKQNVLLVGYGKRIEDYCEAAAEQGEKARLVVVGQYLSKGHVLEGINQVIASSLAEAADEVNADIIIISFPHEDKDIEWQLIDAGKELFGPKVYTLPGIPRSYAGTRIADFHNIPTLQLNSAELTLGKRFLKRSFDLITCSIAVILLSPLYIILALLVKLSSKGPVFFKQKRVTKDGKVFTMLKFRSMRTDMPEGDFHWTEENDPRVTKIGKFLRKTSLDEIPQFFNVLEGSMSLIGPRPERPELEEQFEKKIPGYHMRHIMKAGISGWAQVNGLRGNTSLEKRIDFDLYYVRNWSFRFDIKIVFLTFFKGFVNENAY